MKHVTADSIKDDEVLDFADTVRALTVRALGEEDDLPPSHPMVIAAKRKLAVLINALAAVTPVVDLGDVADWPDDPYPDADGSDSCGPRGLPSGRMRNRT